jgi:hypothetical protein
MGRHDDLIAEAELLSWLKFAHTPEQPGDMSEAEWRERARAILVALPAALAEETARADREAALADRLAEGLRSYTVGVKVQEVAARRDRALALLAEWDVARAAPSGSEEQETDRG